MDETDKRLILALKRDARASVLELAAQLALSRTTVRKRMARLRADGEIVAYTTITRFDVTRAPVRGLMMLGIDGQGLERAMARISILPQINAVHSTNGTWDLIAEIETQTLEEFDQVLTRIRAFDGIERSETNLLLTTRSGRS